MLVLAHTSGVFGGAIAVSMVVTWLIESEMRLPVAMGTHVIERWEDLKYEVMYGIL